jgi:RNA polymerase sigma factor (sigma-70 family)
MSNVRLGPVMRQLRRLGAAPGGEASDAELIEQFSARRHQAAFSALVDRYGPLVWSVCRHVLRQEQDVEDAFQATFLVLAQKAGSIRKREAVASWLHGVAYRVAIAARRDAARRRVREQKCRQPASETPVPEAALQELQAILDEEVGRLPEKYRAPFVLCCLDGKSTAEAAGLLSWKVGTVSGRLSRARQMLRRRLTRRGLALSTALCAIAVSRGAAASCVPAGLARNTARIALTSLQGSAAAVPSSVAALVRGVHRTMQLAYVRNVGTALLAVAVSLAGVGLLTRAALAGRDVDPPLAAAEAPERPRELPPSARTAGPERSADGAIAYRGRVVDPEGKPVKDAKVYLFIYDFKKWSLPVRAVTGTDGRYEFTVPRSEFGTAFGPEPWKHAAAVALAEGYGMALPALSLTGTSDMTRDQTLRLVRDDVPLDGRVLDLQGKPVAGARIRVRGISLPQSGDLSRFIQTLKTEKQGLPTQFQQLMGFRDPYHGWDLDTLFPPVTTGADGRYRIRGIGRERMADLLIEGPGIETKYVYALTRRCETVAVPAYRGRDAMPAAGGVVYTHYGATFDHVAPPSNPVVGTVRDRDTGRPIAGAIVQRSFALPTSDPRPIDERVILRAVTDRGGHYRITGLPLGKGVGLRTAPPPGQPYLMKVSEVPERPGLGPVPLDVDLKRGVWIHGKVSDKVTGKPVRCRYLYFAFQDNPHLKEVGQLDPGTQDERVAEDGTFRVAGLPGRGIVAVQAFDDRYLPAGGPKSGPPLQTSPYLFFAGQYHAFAEINPAEGAESVRCDLVLDPGRTLTGTVRGPDGEALAGALGCGLDTVRFWHHQPLPTATFTVRGLRPGEPRRLLFAHPAKRLAGTILVRGDENGALTVQLEPWGTLTGRLVDAEGKPLKDVQILSDDGVVMTAQGMRPPPLDTGTLLHRVEPDASGNFRIEGLVPGLRYNLLLGRGNYIARITGTVGRNVQVKSGETKDLGEVRARPFDQ